MRYGQGFAKNLPANSQIKPKEWGVATVYPRGSDETCEVAFQEPLGISWTEINAITEEGVVSCEYEDEQVKQAACKEIFFWIVNNDKTND